MFSQDGTLSFLVRFSGFSEKHNEWFNAKEHASRLMPVRSHTGKLRVISTLTKDPVSQFIIYTFVMISGYTRDGTSGSPKYTPPVYADVG